MSYYYARTLTLDRARKSLQIRDEHDDEEEDIGLWSYFGIPQGVYDVVAPLQLALQTRDLALHQVELLSHPHLDKDKTNY